MKSKDPKPYAEELMITECRCGDKDCGSVQLEGKTLSAGPMSKSDAKRLKASWDALRYLKDPSALPNLIEKALDHLEDSGVVTPDRLECERTLRAIIGQPQK